MKGKRKALAIVITALVLNISLLLWNKPSITIETITWSAPKPFGIPIELMSCDLDNDGNEEIVIDRGWHLQLKGKRWQVEKLPLKRSETFTLRPLKRFLLIKTHKNDLLLLRKSNGWQKQKLAEDVFDVWTPRDWEGSNEDDDLLILSRASILLWFKVKGDGKVSLQDILKIPKFKTVNRRWDFSSPYIRVGNTEATVFPWRGKLRWIKGCWERNWADLDADKKPDLVMVDKKRISALLTNQEDEGYIKPRVVVASTTMSQKPTQRHLRFISIHLPVNLFSYGFFDLDGDGRSEVIGTDERGYVHRFWLENNRWRREKAPFAVEGAPFTILKVGKQNWLLFAPQDFPYPNAIFTAICRSKSGWGLRIWFFGRKDSLLLERVWNEGRLSLLLLKTPFPARLVMSLDKWLSQMGISLPPLPIQTEIRQTQIWLWDERKRTWKLKEIWDGFAKFVDLDRDGLEERVLFDGEGGRWIKLAVYSGRFWKQWWTVTLRQEPYAAVTTLRQQDRTWVVTVEADRKTVRAWTLRK